MALVSMLELTGSPVEQASWSAQTYYWDPSAELQAGETISAPTASVLMYDPATLHDTTDVTATVVENGYPQIGVGQYENQVVIRIKAALQKGKEYRVQLGCTGSSGSTPARFFRISCRV